MSNLSERRHLDPNDPAYYAPRRLRERSGSSSLAHEARSDHFSDPISPSASLDIPPLGNVVSGALRHSVPTAIIHEPVRFAREGRRATLYGVGALLIFGVLAIATLFFVIMAPVSRQSDAAPTVSETKPPVRAVLPQSAAQEEVSKPAISEFQALIAPTAPGENTRHEQSEQMLQRFLQWRQKPNASETSRQ
jgi:hypothetical protein